LKIQCVVKLCGFDGDCHVKYKQVGKVFINLGTCYYLIKRKDSTAFIAHIARLPYRIQFIQCYSRIFQRKRFRVTPLSSHTYTSSPITNITRVTHTGILKLRAVKLSNTSAIFRTYLCQDWTRCTVYIKYIGIY